MFVVTRNKIKKEKKCIEKFHRKKEKQNTNRGEYKLW